MPPLIRSLTSSSLCLPIEIRHNAICKNRVSLIHIAAVNGHIDGLPLANQDHFFLRSGYCRVEQIAPEHDVVLLEKGDNRCRHL